ncbi:MAG: RNHCP domain-containing protein [Spirochaetae bacterium HGW-Spirochaetae-10]|nr:MAG: RNHCP domain-containing protein [Spirochaetae bacterium HGW-Spirochaetae-10]
MPGSDRPPLLFEEQSSEARAKAAQTKYVADESDYTFRCRHCGQLIGTAGAGTKNRNHCPHCLHSLHVDNEPGDRASLCRSVMEPISVWVRRDGEWALLHRCKSCGTIHSNRIAADDNETMLLSLAVRPLANPAFSLERLGAEAT